MVVTRTVIQSGPSTDGYDAPGWNSGLAVHFISPVAQGDIWGSGKKDDLTVGAGFRFLKNSTIRGIRFNSTHAGTKNWKVGVYDFTIDKVLYHESVNTLPSGTNVITFKTPLTISNLKNTYVAFVYDTSGLIYPGYDGHDKWTTGLPTLVGPHIMAVGNYFANGDTPPSIPTPGTEAYATEFIFTVL